MAEINTLKVGQNPAYPGNSNLEHEQKEKVEKVVTGEVVMKKPSLGKKIATTFLGANPSDVKSWLRDNAILWIKNTVLDGLAIMMFGRPYSNGSYRVPNVVSNVSRFTLQPTSRGPLAQTVGAQNNQSPLYNSLGYAEYSDADTVLTGLVERIDRYGRASISNMYDLSGITNYDFTMAYWGWRNLGSATITVRPDGLWQINLPTPIDIRN